MVGGTTVPFVTGVPRSYENAPPWDPTVGLCLGTYGDPRRVGVSYERGTPVHFCRASREGVNALDCQRMHRVALK